MAEVCGAEHPDLVGVSCDKDAPCSGYHAAGGEVWGIEALPARTTATKARSRVQTALDGAQRPVRTGPPIVRRTDPSTSQRAAQGVAVVAGSHRGRLLAAYIAADGPLTDAEAAAAAEMPERSCWWKRCSELRQGGWIEVVGERIDPQTRAAVVACQPTPKGRAHLA